MKCDLCDNEAVVHDTVKDGGAYVAKHLCAEHAAEHGIGVQVSGNPSATTIIHATIAPGGGIESSPRCPECGLAYAEFRRSGVLGCAGCYEAFEKQLGPLLERAHEGGLHHVGKVPRRALASSRDRGAVSRAEFDEGREALRRRVRELERQLVQAVRSEQFERAARIRDEVSQTRSLIEELEVPARPADSPNPPGAEGETGTGE